MEEIPLRKMRQSHGKHADVGPNSAGHQTRDLHSVRPGTPANFLPQRFSSKTFDELYQIYTLRNESL